MMDYYNLGVFSGIFFGLLLVVVIYKFFRKKSCGKSDDYDERQAIIRNRGYRYAYFTALAGILLAMILKTAFVFDGIPSYTFLLSIVMFLSLGVHVVYCVMNDAYFAPSTNKRKFIIIMIILSIYNLWFGITSIIRETPDISSDSMRGYVNMECGIIFLIVGLAMFIKSRIDRKEEEE